MESSLNTRHVEFFESLTGADVVRFVEERRQEDLHLDFKTCANDGLSRDDRKNFAKAVSGFANAEGGLIIWGVECRKNEEDVDCAQAIQGGSSAEKTLSQLVGLTGGSAGPAVEGVNHRLVDTGDGHVVLTLVPQSDAAPHMARLGEHRYYRRSGSSFYRMEHYEIVDIMKRRRLPRLEFYTRFARPGRVVVGIRNSGSVLARFPFLHLDVDPPYRLSEHGVDGNGQFGLTPVHYAGRQSLAPDRFEGTSDQVIHPGMERDVTVVDVHQVTEPLTIHYGVAAQDAQVWFGSKVVREQELLGH